MSAEEPYELIASWKDNMGSGVFYKFCNSVEAARKVFAYYLEHEEVVWIGATIQLSNEVGGVIKVIEQWTQPEGWQPVA